MGTSVWSLLLTLWCTNQIFALLRGGAVSVSYLHISLLSARRLFRDKNRIWQGTVVHAQNAAVARRCVREQTCQLPACCACMHLVCIYNGLVTWTTAVASLPRYSCSMRFVFPGGGYRWKLAPTDRVTTLYDNNTDCTMPMPQSPADRFYVTMTHRPWRNNAFFGDGGTINIPCFYLFSTTGYSRWEQYISSPSNPCACT